MNYYALIYETVDDYVARRAEFREMHLRMAREARERGELLLAGAFDDPVDRALLVFRAADKSKVEEFARNDPYVVNGLVRKWEVRCWKVVDGNDQRSPPWWQQAQSSATGRRAPPKRSCPTTSSTFPRRFCRNAAFLAI